MGFLKFFSYLSRNPMGTMLEQAIERNRIQQFRFRRAERILREVRLRIFDYEDEGKLEKAKRVIEKCKAILMPLWEAQNHDSSEKRLRNYMM